MTAIKGEKNLESIDIKGDDKEVRSLGEITKLRCKDTNHGKYIIFFKLFNIKI